MENQNQNVSADNIYKLNGRVPLSKAIPFGLQHVLAMFVSNLAPVLIVCSAAFVHGTNHHLTGAEITPPTQQKLGNKLQYPTCLSCHFQGLLYTQT